MKAITRKILGVVLIAIGLIALVTPCSPGSWLALIGLELLGFGMLLEKKLLPLIKNPHRRRIRILMRKARAVLGIKKPASGQGPHATDASDRQSHHAEPPN